MPACMHSADVDHHAARGRSHVATLASGCLVASAFALLAGCANTMHTSLGTLMHAWGGGAQSPPDPAALDRRYRYLRARVDHRVAFMVWADDEHGPQGSTSVWYSADGVVLRLVDGRLAGITDGPRSWRWVSAVSPPDWRAVAAGGSAPFEQVIDRQPGWRFGERRVRVVRAIAGAPASHQAVGLPPGVQWFEERNTTGSAQPAWYAVEPGAARVLYGQACVEDDWCLSWQPWPVPAGSAQTPPSAPPS